MPGCTGIRAVCAVAHVRSTRVTPVTPAPLHPCSPAHVLLLPGTPGRRVAAGLWPLQAGEVTLPPKGELFYLSQRPYLVAGTLRDQLLYPEPPRAVYAASKSERSRARVEPWMRSLCMSEEELEDRLRCVCVCVCGGVCVCGSAGVSVCETGHWCVGGGVWGCGVGLGKHIRAGRGRHGAGRQRAPRLRVFAACTAEPCLSCSCPSACLGRALCCSECLEAVELDYLLIRGRGWDQVGGRGHGVGMCVGCVGWGGGGVGGVEDKLPCAQPCHGMLGKIPGRHSWCPGPRHRGSCWGTPAATRRPISAGVVSSCTLPEPDAWLAGSALE